MLSSFVKKGLMDPQVSTNYIIEEDIHRGYESVKCYPTPNVWRTAETGIWLICNRQLLICWWAFWNWAFFIKFTKLMYYRLTFEIQCISSSQWLNFRMFISRWVTTCLITVWLKPCLRVVAKYVPFFFKHLLSSRGIDVLRVRVGKSFGNDIF